jgi:TPR repeat protein
MQSTHVSEEMLKQRMPESQPSFIAAFNHLVGFLTGFYRLNLPEDECMALAVAALSGHPRAEFLVASAYDAADDALEARIWYERAARRGHLPAMLQLRQFIGASA